MKITNILTGLKHNPVRFEIVHQRLYSVYGFEEDSAIGVLYGAFNTPKRAKDRLKELEIYYGVVNK